MTVGQIAIRQEVRQLLNEAGINRNTLKDIVKEVLHEEIQKTCNKILHENDLDAMVCNAIDANFDKIVRDTTAEVIKKRCSNVFDHMQISVDVTNSSGTSVVTR